MSTAITITASYKTLHLTSPIRVNETDVTLPDQRQLHINNGDFLVSINNKPFGKTNVHYSHISEDAQETISGLHYTICVTLLIH